MEFMETNGHWEECGERPDDRSMQDLCRWVEGKCVAFAFLACFDCDTPLCGLC